MDVLDLTPLGVDHQDCASSASHVRVEDRTGRPYLYVEALPHYRLRVGIQQDGELVARRVLELLDHQLAASRGRRPVHAAQGLALFVLPHAVKLEPAVPAEEEPLPIV